MHLLRHRSKDVHAPMYCYDYNPEPHEVIDPKFSLQIRYEDIMEILWIRGIICEYYEYTPIYLVTDLYADRVVNMRVSVPQAEF